jgi:hypothetical protein
MRPGKKGKISERMLLIIKAESGSVMHYKANVSI